MMKAIFVAITCIVCYQEVGAQQANGIVVFKGTVLGENRGYDQIYYYSEDNPSPDSVTIKDGKFMFTIPFRSKHVQLLYTQFEVKTKGYFSPFEVLVEAPRTISFSGIQIEKGLASGKVSANKATELFHNFIRARNRIIEKVDALKTDNRDSAFRVAMATLINSTVRANPNQYVSGYLLSTYGKVHLSEKQLQNAYSLLSPTIRNSEEGEKIAAFIKGLHTAKVGMTVPNLVLNDNAGKPVTLESFRGKYVWVDFWTSWCGPCRQSFPHMRELYQKYYSTGLEIIGISADTKKTAWLKATSQMNNPWIQLWDDKTVTSQFAVTGFPTSFLIDPAGKILIREVGYEEGKKGQIELELERIFKK